MFRIAGAASSHSLTRVSGAFAQPIGARAVARALPIAAAMLSFVLAAVVLFSSSGQDDSHITYWSAHALKVYGEIVNVNGERVEQSSSLAHVVLLAALGLLTRASMPTLGPITSLAGGLAAIALTARLGRLASGRAAAPALLVATAGSVVYWGTGGLETTLAAAALAWFAIEGAGYVAAPSRRAAMRAAASIVVVLTVRPEAPFVVAACLLTVGVYALWRAPASLRPTLHLIGFTVATAALLFAFRHFYFGAWFPNPVYAKGAAFATARGLGYIKRSVVPVHAGLVTGAALGLIVTLKDVVRGRAPEAEGDDAAPFARVLCAAAAVAILGFTVLVGGDWMKGGRFLAPAVPVFAVLGVHGISRIIRDPRGRTAAIATLVATNLYGIFDLAAHSTGRPIWTTGRLRAQVRAHVGSRGYSWFELTSLIHLRDAFAAAALVDVVGTIREAEPDRRLTAMSCQGGMLPYYVAKNHPGAVRFVDRCALVTRDFTSCLPPSDFDDLRPSERLTLERYFANQEVIDAACGTTRPDILFGVRGPAVGALRSRGYTVYYQQHGTMVAGGEGDILAQQHDATEWIAVDAELAARVKLQPRKPWEFDLH